jgi:sulfide dehydrogenase [flavocytochrome c] flavoprotein subunit
MIADAAGLVGPDKNWCPVNPTTFESTLQKDIHVIGDASIAGAMPKSGYSANSEAKVCANNIVALMNGKEITEMSGHQHLLQLPLRQGSSQRDRRVQGERREAGHRGRSRFRCRLAAISSEVEAIYAESWLKNILTEMST